MGTPPVSTLVYILDEQDRIQSVSDGWDEFGRANSAQPPLADKLVGTPIWRYFKGSETISLYRQLFRKVRQAGRPVDIPIQCDSPSVRRVGRIRVERISELGRLRVETRLHEVSARPETVPWLDASRGGSGRELNICSICRRVSLDASTWIEIDEALGSRPDLVASASPQLQERVCPECVFLQSDCRYLLSGDTQTQEALPLVVFLHGARHDEYLLRLQAPPRLIGRDGMPSALVVSPICRESAWNIDEVLEVIDFVANDPRVDRSRIYLTGISIGALAVWKVLPHRKNFFAAAIAISALPALRPNLFEVKTPVWSISGELDPMCNPELSRQVMDQLAAFGVNVIHTIIENVGHDCWSAAYQDENLWSWLFAHRRGHSPTETPPPALAEVAPSTAEG